MSTFHPRAQQVLVLARKEAERLNQRAVGCEHLLFGMIALGRGTAVIILRTMVGDIEIVRKELEGKIRHGPVQNSVGGIPYTLTVKQVLIASGQEAERLHHSYIGTEHLLLGLLTEHGGIAAEVLKKLGVTLEQTRIEVLKELDPNISP